MNYNMFYKKTVDFLKPITLHFEHSNVFSLEVFSITKVVIEFNYVLFSNSKNKFKVMKTRQQCAPKYDNTANIHNVTRRKNFFPILKYSQSRQNKIIRRL